LLANPTCSRVVVAEELRVLAALFIVHKLLRTRLRPLSRRSEESLKAFAENIMSLELLLVEGAPDDVQLIPGAFSSVNNAVKALSLQTAPRLSHCVPRPDFTSLDQKRRKTVGHEVLALVKEGDALNTARIATAPRPLIRRSSKLVWTESMNAGNGQGGLISS
jgi:hypothetical protein